MLLAPLQKCESIYFYFYFIFYFFLVYLISVRGITAPSSGLCEGSPTFTSPLDLTHAVQGVGHQVGQASVQVHGGQAALEALLGVHQFGQLFEHLLRHAADVKVACCWGRER